MYDGEQLNLFKGQSINPTHEIKRQIKLIMSTSRLSRDEIVDKMNSIATRDGIKGSVSKSTIDSWTKDSDPTRLPSIPWLIIFCKVMDNMSPVAAIAEALGLEVIGAEGSRILRWGKAELEKKKAIKKARLAFEEIE